MLVVSAPAGYRKALFLREYGACAGRFAGCDISAADAGDAARPVLETIVSGDHVREARAAADRLAQPPELAAAASRETLRREWPFAREREVFVLRDPSGVLASPAGVDLVGELVATLPAERTLALSVRAPLPAALRALLPAQRTVDVGTADLVLGPAEVDEVARRFGVAPSSARAVCDAVAGWPLVTSLLVGLLRSEPPGEVLEAASILGTGALLAFGMQRTIAKCPEIVRDALVVAALQRGATQKDVVRVLGEAFDDLSFARLSALPFVVTDGEHVIVHPEIGALLRLRFAALVKALYERLLSVLTGDGAYAGAARIALDSGDVTRAAAIIDAAPPYTTGAVALGDYGRIIERIDCSLVTSYPNLWIATIPYRTFAVDRAAFVREAQTVYYCLPTGASPDQRAATVMLLANAYVNVGRVDEGHQLLDEALRGFASEPGSARASVLNFLATVRGTEGRFAVARSLAADAAAITRAAFWDNRTLHYIDAHEAGYRGEIERAVVIFDELLRRTEREELPLYLAYGAVNGAFFAWVYGDDATFERYLRVVEDALTPGIERGLRPIVDAARGRRVEMDDEYQWSAGAAIAQLFRMGNAADDRDALDAARGAARAADHRRDPYVRILAHVALYVLDRERRGDEQAVLATILPLFESPEMHAAIAALVAGKPPGILESFVRSRVLREGSQQRTEAQLVVELLAGRISRDGVAVRLSEKELEFVTYLAASAAALTRDRIGEALWEHLDPEEWPNNLKVTLSRVRSKLGARDAVLSSDGRYRLSPAIDVDLRRAEARMRELGDRALDAAARGELLAIVAAHRTGAAERYERFAWSHPLVARINDLVSNAAIALARDAVAHGRHDEVLRYTDEIAAFDPYNETASELAIRVHLERGAVDAARREFRRYATALADELGATPSEHLARLVRSA